MSSWSHAAWPPSGTLDLVGKRVGVVKADVERLLRAVQRANDFVRAQPKRAEAIFVSKLGADPAFASWSMQRVHAILALDEALLRSLQSQANWAVREGYVAGKKQPDFRAP